MPLGQGKGGPLFNVVVDLLFDRFQGVIPKT